MTKEEIRRALESGDRVLSVHLIGVAGSGMSGLAGLLLAMGHRVSGSDRVTTAETERLQREGLVFSSPHQSGEVSTAEVVVYSTAIKAGNVAFDATVALGIPMLRRAEALASIMRRKRGIVVAGTHGKTTTSAMAAHVLRGGGLEPSHYVGAEIPILGRNARLGDGEYFVAEGDESDGTLVEFRPEISIVLNLEAEHLDHYGDEGIEGIKKVFQVLLEQTAGVVIFCGDDEGARSVCDGRDGSIGYGFGDGCLYRGSSVRVLGQSSEFSVRRGEDLLGTVVLNIPGRHNILNSLAVVALATELGVGFRAIADALATFSGAKRRFDNRFTSENFRVVDDYGHHPTEVAATIAAARGLEPNRVLCVFQPHRYSRTKLLREDFGRAFDGVDELFVTDVYAASEAPIDGVSGETIVSAVNENGGSAVSTPTLADANRAAGNALRAGDLV
ncbi:MAG: UDP-N-acetylmuramate--L-alanine ligase, partial [Verrucomicrobiales bacterium]|nr:UDP-N-acetylmuramate--L-alanine ligase [Verrucomicrobiales bacterium]